jgi:hypothetical protein
MRLFTKLISPKPFTDNSHDFDYSDRQSYNHFCGSDRDFYKG